MEITEIKQQLTLVQVLQHLHQHCPFHGDKTPLQVYYKTHMTYCFSISCKTHGRAMDVIDFVMHKENCTKHEAIEKCKELIGGAVINSPETLTRIVVLTKSCRSLPSILLLNADEAGEAAVKKYGAQ